MAAVFNCPTPQASDFRSIASRSRGTCRTIEPCAVMDPSGANLAVRGDVALQPIVVRVDDDHATGVIDDQAFGPAELAWLASPATPLGQPQPSRRELLHPIVATVRNIDV